MNILVNGKPYSFESRTLEELLREMNLLDRHGVAVALNEQVMPRITWPQQAIDKADRITIIQATAGG
jgi:sulfur carrier protein